jgi:glycine oxidase
MNVVIIGNGILAVTTALRLTQRAKETDKIYIIGKKSRPGSATMAAAAMLNSFCEVEVGSLESEVDLFRFELSYQATRMWPKFVRDYLEVAMKHDCLIDDCKDCSGSNSACYGLGTYLINNTSSDSLDDANYNAVIKALQDYIEPYNEVDPKEIPNYKPHERNRANRAIYIPNEGWLNPKLTLRVLDGILEALPCIEFVDEEVESIEKVGNSIENVILKNGNKISGDKFLLATGATSSEIIDRSNLGISIPKIFYGAGVSIQIKSPNEPHTKAIRTPNRGLACGIYTVPFYTSTNVPLDEIIVGASSYLSPVPIGGPRVGSVQGLLNGAMEQINSNFFRAEITEINLGFRPVSADTYPVIGQTSIPNLVVATGTKRDGFHLSPLLSEVLMKLIFDEEIDPRFKVFSPERKLIRELSREKAIEMSVKHLVSSSYQHGFVPSHDRLAEKIKQMYRKDLDELHDKVGAHNWGIPPELLDLYRYGHIV